VCVGANSRRKFSSQNFTILTLCWQTQHP
jgi:hypothetical protein